MTKAESVLLVKRLDKHWRGKIILASFLVTASLIFAMFKYVFQKDLDQCSHLTDQSQFISPKFTIICCVMCFIIPSRITFLFM